MRLLFSFCFLEGLAYGQFSGSVQGIVQDPAGSVVPKAAVTLLNTATQVSSSTTTNQGGEYRFLSLAPGSYEVTAEAPGFARSTVRIGLETSQNLNVTIAMTLSSASQSVEVSAEAPVLNTAESRNQLTLETQALSSLPLAGRNMISLVTLAPRGRGDRNGCERKPGFGRRQLLD
jgi:hypothetical protein